MATVSRRTYVWDDLRVPLSATSRCMKIGLTSNTLSLTDLSMIAYWTIRFRLMSVPGVANVAIWGERIKLLAVEVVPDRLRRHEVTLNEVERNAFYTAFVATEWRDACCASPKHFSKRTQESWRNSPQRWAP